MANDIAPIGTTSTTATTTAAPDTAVKEPTPYASMLPLLLIFVVFYFLLIRPQQKKLREHASMIKDLKKGEKVVTSGGIIGTIYKMESDDTISVEIATDIRVRVMKDSITQIMGDKVDKKEKGAPAKPKKSANDN